MKTGDVVLFKAQKDFIDEAIEYVTKSEYTHAALAISETEIVEAWWNGVRRSTMNGRGPHTIFTPVKPLTDIEAATLRGFGLGKIGEEYDFKQLVGFPIEKILHLDKNALGSRHSVICSQLVYQAYLAIGRNLVPDKEEYSIAPSDLATSDILRRDDQ